MTPQELYDAAVALEETLRNSAGDLDLAVMWDGAGFTATVWDVDDEDRPVARAVAGMLPAALVGVHDALVQAGHAAVAL